MYFSYFSDLFIMVEVVVCNSQEFVRTQLLVIFVTWISGLIIKIFFSYGHSQVPPGFLKETLHTGVKDKLFFFFFPLASQSIKMPFHLFDVIGKC